MFQHIHATSDSRLWWRPSKREVLIAIEPLSKNSRNVLGILLLAIFFHEFRSSNIEARNLEKHVLSLEVGRHAWLGHSRNLLFVPVHIVTDQ